MSETSGASPYYDSRVDTWKHIETVRRYLDPFIHRLQRRADIHDQSKLNSPEREMFDEFTPKLRDLTYGSPEYKACTAAMGDALKHHYEHNHDGYIGPQMVWVTPQVSFVRRWI